MPHMSATRTTTPTSAEQMQQNIAIALHQGANIIKTARIIKAPETRAIEAVQRWLMVCGINATLRDGVLVVGSVTLRWDAHHLRWSAVHHKGSVKGKVHGVRLVSEMLAWEVAQ